MSYSVRNPIRDGCFSCGLTVGIDKNYVGDNGVHYIMTATDGDRNMLGVWNSSEKSVIASTGDGFVFKKDVGTTGKKSITPIS